MEISAKKSFQNFCFLASLVIVSMGCAPQLSVHIVAPSNNQNIANRAVDVKGIYTIDFKRAPIENLKKEPKKFKITVNGKDARIIADTNPFTGKFEATNIPLSVGVNSVSAKIEYLGLLKKYSVLDVLSASHGIFQQAEFGSNGGTLKLPEYAAASFSPDTFASNTQTVLAVTNWPDTREDFSDSNDMLGALSRLEYEIRVNTRNIKPARPVQLSITIPGSYVSNLPAGAVLMSYIEILSETENEVTDAFRVFPSKFDATMNVLNVEIPDYAFTQLRSADNSYEAIVIVGAVARDPAH